MIKRISIIIFVLLFFVPANLISLVITNSNTLSEQEKKEYFESGKNYFQKKQYVSAIKEWDPIIETKQFNNKELKQMMYECYKQIYNAKQYYINGMEDFKNRDLLSAKQNFIQATNIYPSYEEAKDMIVLVEKYIGIDKDLKQAEKLISEKKYDESIKICKNVLKLQPDNVRAQKLIQQSLLMLNNDKIAEQINKMIATGITYFSNKEYESSKQVFNNVLKLDSNNFTAIEYIDKINQILSDLKEKELMVQEAEKYYQEGKKFYNSTQYSNALTQFQNVISLIPDYKDSNQYIEKINQKLNEIELAKQKERERLALEYLSQGITYYYNSEYKMSISMLEKCLKIDPENEYAIQYLQKAKEAMLYKEEEYISEDSPYYEFYVKLKRKALYYYDIGNYETSLKWWSKILKLFPSNKEAREMAIIITLKLNKNEAEEFLAIHFQSGKNLLKNNEYRAALKEFQMIEKINPEYQNVKAYIDRTMKYLEKPPLVKLPVEILKKYYENGIELYKESKYDEAIQEWNKILEDNSPDNPYRVNAIVNINKAKQKKNFSAQALITKKENSNPDKYSRIAQQHYLKGIAFYVKGKYVDAIKEWQIVLKYEPDNINAKNNIAKCKRKLNYAQ